MPSGKVHDIITISLTPIILIGLYLLFNLPIIAMITFGYLFGSFMFNGDLDIVSRPYRRWGFLKFIWKPYQKMFHHRSIYTHGIIIGTVVRVIYITWLPILLLLVYGNYHQLTMKNFDWLIYFIIGIEIGSAIHTIADFTYSLRKKM